MFNGERFKELRKNKGLSQTDMARILGVTKSSICCYEKGTRNPCIENLVDIVCYFNVSCDYLLNNDVYVTVMDNKNKKTVSMSNNEVAFIKELRKDKYLSEILLDDAQRSMQLLSKKI